MLAALALSVAQLGDRRVLAVLAKSLALTLAVLAGLGTALWFAADAAARALGLGGGGGAAAGALALLGGLVVGWVLFRAVAIACVGVFADEVVGAVEARHYPAAAARARDVPPARALAMAAGGVGRSLGVNALALPLYLLLLATGVGLPVAVFAVNAALLGRELGDMVAARHRPSRELPAFRRATRGPRLLLGAAGTALLLVPVLNLIAPVLSAAMATHLYHRKLAR